MYINTELLIRVGGFIIYLLFMILSLVFNRNILKCLKSSNDETNYNTFSEYEYVEQLAQALCDCLLKRSSSSDYDTKKGEK